MAVEVGKTYYAIQHVYHHFIFEVVEILGPQRCWATKIIRVQSDPRGWTDFFQQGIRNKEETVYTHWPDGEISWPGGVFEWNHSIPEMKNATNK
jgi:hypothetical protein